MDHSGQDDCARCRANLVPAARAGVLLGWVTEIPLPGSEKQPGRPVQPRAGGPRRSQRPRGPSLVHPGDGPWSSDPGPEGAACHPELPAKSGESCCVPSPVAAGQACGPRACAARARRPRIIDALACAREWRRLLDTGEVKNAAELARRQGVTRARISQLMSLLRLAPEILEYIDGLDGTEGGLHLTARRLRDIAVLDDHGRTAGPIPRSAWRHGGPGVPCRADGRGLTRRWLIGARGPVRRAGAPSGSRRHSPPAHRGPGARARRVGGDRDWPCGGTPRSCGRTRAA